MTTVTSALSKLHRGIALMHEGLAEITDPAAVEQARIQALLESVVPKQSIASQLGQAAKIKRLKPRKLRHGEMLKSADEFELEPIATMSGRV